jgi:hypothetical protein
MKLKDFYPELITENVQKAEKKYFSTGLLSERWKTYILKLTDSDFTTYSVASLIYYYLSNGIMGELTEKVLNEIIKNIREYDNNVFPIKGFSSEMEMDNTTVETLNLRSNVISSFKSFPSIASRNTKGDIRKPRDLSQMHSLRRLLEYISGQLTQLDNRTGPIRDKMLRKVFSSDHKTFEQISDFLDEKEEIIGDVDIKKSDILDLAKKERVDVVYNKNNVVILEITSPQEMRKFGCLGLWCFTYGDPNSDSAYKQFSSYSTNDIVYLIYNFNVNSSYPEFGHVLIKPISENKISELLHYINNQTNFRFKYDTDQYDEGILYDMTNSSVDSPELTIYNMAKDLSIFEVFTFGGEND